MRKIKLTLQATMKRSILTILISIALFNIELIKANSATTEAPPRWFEIEIIIFKSTHSQGLFDESWKKNIQLAQSNQLIDFLQPFEKSMIKSDSIEDNTVTQPSLNTAKQTVETQNLKNTSSEINLSSTNINPAEVETLTKHSSEMLDETPFKLLPNEFHELNNEAKSLQRHPDYKVLAHYRWRQPVLNSTNATHIRIAGGQDFSSQYHYDGSKIDLTEQAITPSITAFTQNSDEAIMNEDSLKQSVKTSSHSAINHVSLLSSTQEETTQTKVDNTPLISIVKKPWVPELDGDIKIYLNRYLHIRTNLYLRRPDKEAVEIIDREMFKNDHFNSFINETTNTNSLMNNHNETLTDAVEPIQNIDHLLSKSSTTSFDYSENKTNENISQNSGSQFSWEIDDDFLETESEKIYIERLFNYSLKQSRRIKSGELHFFDHPLIGVLIMIKPYEFNVTDLENNLSSSVSM